MNCCTKKKKKKKIVSGLIIILKNPQSTFRFGHKYVGEKDPLPDVGCQLLHERCRYSTRGDFFVVCVGTRLKFVVVGQNELRAESIDDARDDIDVANDDIQRRNLSTAAFERLGQRRQSRDAAVTSDALEVWRESIQDAAERIVATFVAIGVPVFHGRRERKDLLLD